MESACSVILNSTNYFQWLPHIVDLLRSKGIYRIATWQESKLTDGGKTTKWENKKDEAWWLVWMSIAQDHRFHIQ